MVKKNQDFIRDIVSLSELLTNQESIIIGLTFSQQRGKCTLFFGGRGAIRVIRREVIISGFIHSVVVLIYTISTLISV